MTCSSFDSELASALSSLVTLRLAHRRGLTLGSAYWGRRVEGPGLLRRLSLHKPARRSLF